MYDTKKKVCSSNLLQVSICEKKKDGGKHAHAQTAQAQVSRGPGFVDQYSLAAFIYGR